MSDHIGIAPNRIRFGLPVAASVIPHVRFLIASQTGSSPSPEALHDTTALHTVAQISAQSTDAGFLAGGIFALAAVVLARDAINVKRPEAQPPRD
jgi:hypothetical protein